MAITSNSNTCQIKKLSSDDIIENDVFVSVEKHIENHSEEEEDQFVELTIK